MQILSLQFNLILARRELLILIHRFSFLLALIFDFFYCLSWREKKKETKKKGKNEKRDYFYTLQSFVRKDSQKILHAL